MKKFWYLIPALVFALGIVACGEDNTEPDPTPTPPSSEQTEEATPKAVTDLVVKAGLNEATLSWNLPTDQSSVKKIKVGVKVGGENTINWTVLDQVCSSYTVTDLDKPTYYFEVRTVNDKKDSVGATSDLVEIYSLDAFSAPRFELYEDAEGWVLKATNLSTSISVFHSVEWYISDSRNIVCEGDYTASAEEIAAISQKQSTINEMEWRVDCDFDDESDYTISYKIEVYPALGGALNTSNNTYYYEGGVLDQAYEMEEATSEVVTQLTPDPMVLHFWGGDSPNVGYETIAMAWDTPYGVEKYLIYYGADYDSATIVEVDKNSDKLIAANAVQASDPVGEYAKVWSADKAYIINSVANSPAYVRVEALDSYDRVIAMGQYYTYNFTVRPTQQDIQDHQPKFSIEYQTEGDHQYLWAVTAKHISAARAYAKIISWKALLGGTVVAEGTYSPDAFSVGYKTEPQLQSHSWYFGDSKFEPEAEYTIEYEITYVPVSNSYERGDVTPLDYNPATKEFTPAADPSKPTGLRHDPRVLQPIITDANGNVKYRTKVGNDDAVYTYYDEECRYITLSHCNYDHSRKEVIIKSSDIAAVDADANFTVISSAKPDDIALDLNLSTAIDEGTTRKSTEGGHRGLRSINPLYEAVRLYWNHPASAEIETIVINYGSEEVVLTASNWEVADGKGVCTLTGIKTPTIDIKVTAKKGNEVLSTDVITASVYTIEGVDVKFDVVRNDKSGTWQINVRDICGLNYSFYSLSFNFYKDGKAVFKYPITKNGDGSIDATLEAWCTNRGASSYVNIDNGDWDGTENDQIPGDKLAYGTEYEVRYELYAYPVIYDPVADAEDYHKHPEWIYYSSLNTTPQSAGEKVTTTTTPRDDDASTFSFNAAINDGTVRIQNNYTDGHRGFKAVNGIYQGAKLYWSEIKGANFDVYYKESTAAEYNKVANVTTNTYTFESGTLTARKYDFKVVAYNSSKTEIVSKEVSADIYTMVGVDKNVRFEAVDNGDGTWKLFTYGIGGENYSFQKFEFDIYEKGSATPLFVTITKDIAGTATAWAGNRGASSYNEISNSDYDNTIEDDNIVRNGDIEFFKGFTAGTTYEVKVRYTGYPHIFDATADYQDLHKHPEWHYYSSILLEMQTVPEFTVEFTIPAAK